MPQLTLDSTTIDYDAIVSAYQAQLATNAWNDLLPTGVGQALLSMISTSTEFELEAVRRSADETMYDTMQVKSSMVLLTRTLGVHIQRNIPAGVTCSLTISLSAAPTSATTYTIPAYSAFSLNGQNFFNRAAVSFVVPAGSTTLTLTNVTLYQGTVVQQQIVAQGGTLQRYIVGDSSGQMSDLDLFCVETVGSTPLTYTKSENPLWSFSQNQLVFFENTYDDGNVEVIFGNNTYGNAPAENDVLTFTFVDTLGLSGNSATSGLPVSASSFTQGGITVSFSGTTTSAITGGDNARSPQFYQSYGSSIFLGNGKAIRADEQNAKARTFPGVIDALLLGQSNTSPYDARWINVIQYSLLASGPESTNTGNINLLASAFESFMQTNGPAYLAYLRSDPQAVPINVTATVYCFDTADLTTVEANIMTALTAWFAPQPGVLGYTVSPGDVGSIITSADPGIDYINMSSPSTVVNINGTGIGSVTPIQYASLGTVSLTMLFTPRTARGSS